MGFLMASGRPHTLLSLASLILVGMFAPAWLALSADTSGKDLGRKLLSESSLSSRWV